MESDQGGYGSSSVEGEGSRLSRQSSVTLSLEQSQKKLDELWAQIHEQEQRSGLNLDRNGSLGKITVMDLLFKAGVDGGESSTGSGGGVYLNGLPQQPQWISAAPPPPPPPPPPPQQPSMMSIPLGEISFFDTAFPEAQMMSMRGLSAAHAQKQKRVARVPDDACEKRRKRMIKNRESASRSRARKLAHTYELEDSVERLQKEIERLKSRERKGDSDSFIIDGSVFVCARCSSVN